LILVTELDYIEDVEYLFQLASIELPSNAAIQALSVLARNSEHQYGITKDQQYYAKALAFDRAAACLKSLQQPLLSISQLTDSCPRYIGDHAIRIITELLNTGASVEVDAVTGSDLYQCMTNLTAVYGVGQALAYKWYSCGVKSVSDATHRLLRHHECGEGQQQKRDSELGALLPMGGGDHKRLQTGLAFHNDLVNKPVTLAEASYFRDLIAKLLLELRGPGFTVTLVGGFSRGKSTGHDCDLLITHDVEGREAGAVSDLARVLTAAGMVIHGTFEANSFSPSVLSRDFRVKELRSTLDHFEKWLGVIKLSSKDADSSTVDRDVESIMVKIDGNGCDRRGAEGLPAAKRRALSPNYCAFDSFAEAVAMAGGEAGAASTSRGWLARRVDLIAVPRSQYAYALLGWTGNRLFNRDLRLFAQRQRRMKLTSHGLFDLQKVNNGCANQIYKKKDLKNRYIINENVSID
uniref:POLXc domain-containing protein n=1 Tax=Macrostomum lignano TaxID=282301 RepID=A0A1I8GPC9_9PLAT